MLFWLRRIRHPLLDYAPFVYVSSRYHGCDVYGGISIDEKYAKLFPIQENSVVTYHPKSMCLQTTVYEGDNAFSDFDQCTRQMLAFADYHRLKLEEDMIGHTLIGIHKIQGYKRYREIHAVFHL